MSRGLSARAASGPVLISEPRPGFAVGTVRERPARKVRGIVEKIKTGGNFSGLEGLLPLIYPRKEAKGYGTARQVEGQFRPGERAVVLDDRNLEPSTIWRTLSWLGGQGAALRLGRQLIQEQHPGDTLFLLMGADSLLDLPLWREPRRICEMSVPVAVRRTALIILPGKSFTAPARTTGSLGLFSTQE